MSAEGNGNDSIGTIRMANIDGEPRALYSQVYNSAR